MPITPTQCVTLSDAEKKTVLSIEAAIDMELRANIQAWDQSYTFTFKNGTQLNFRIVNELVSIYATNGWNVVWVPSGDSKSVPEGLKFEPKRV